MSEASTSGKQIRGLDADPASQSSSRGVRDVLPFAKIARLADLSARLKSERLNVVAWLSDTAPPLELSKLLTHLPRRASLVLTGENDACTGLTSGDLRAMADQFDQRWIVLEPDPRQATIGILQQIDEQDAVVVVFDEDAALAQIQRWLAEGEQQREDLFQCND